MKMKKLSMTVQILIAMILGGILGLVLGDRISGVKIIGDIFLRLIQMSVVLLIAGTVVEALGNLDSSELGKIGIKIFFWFSISTIFAAFLGILLGELFKPGKGVQLIAGYEMVKPATQGIYDIIVNFVPTNIMQALAEGNMIQVIVFMFLFGLCISKLRTENTVVKLMEIIVEFNKVILKLVSMIMKLAPIGIFSLIAYTTGTAGVKVLLPLIKFLCVLGLGTIIHLSICIIVTSFYCKVSPMRVFKNILNMTIIAFTTTSSAISLPVKMTDSENKLGVSKRISGLVNPLGMTLNSNGLAIFLTLACITVAQAFGIELSTGEIVKVAILSTLSCLGTVVVPGGGLVALAMVMPALGLPIEGVALLSGIDWFSGMFRTVLNVDIDALVSMIIAKDVKELDYDIFYGRNNKENLEYEMRESNEG